MAGFVRITDVAPRDGLQNESRVIPTAEKVELVRLLSLTGVDEIEVSSFVSPRWVPQLADAAEVFAQVGRFKPPGLIYIALVPNEKGMEAALAVNRAAGSRLIDRVAVFTAASEEFSRRNTNATIAETIERFRPVVAVAHENAITVRAYVSCAIACPYAGPIAPSAVADVSRRLIDIGCDELDLGDTIGAGTPQSVRDMLLAVRDAVGEPAFRAATLHLHDTFGGAAACIPVALKLGIASFDGAAGGLGGCPFASTPGRRAPGNIASETLLGAVRAAGRQSRVDESKLAIAGEFARRLVQSPE